MTVSAKPTPRRNPLEDMAIDESRPIKVICIGAGFSGILTAIRFPQRIPNLELVIYEKNSDIGGTWYENTYVPREKPPSLLNLLSAKNARYAGVGCGRRPEMTLFVV